MLAIDGQPLKAPAVPDELLVGKTGTVVLTVANQAGGQSKDVSVTPLINDYNLRLYDWIRANRERFPSFLMASWATFSERFRGRGLGRLRSPVQGQLDKQGLILTSAGIAAASPAKPFSILRRVHAGLFVNRQEVSSPCRCLSPRAMAVLTNEHSASDGDQFPYYFRQYGLGPLIGQRGGGMQGVGFMP